MSLLKDTQQIAFGSAFSSIVQLAKETYPPFIYFLLATWVPKFVRKQVLSIMRSSMGFCNVCVQEGSYIITIKEAFLIPLHKGKNVKSVLSLKGSGQLL